MTQEHLPLGFAALPLEKQKEIREGSRAILELAYQHVGALIIGEPPSAHTTINSASCFAIELQDRFYLATAEHVLRFSETHPTFATEAWQVGQLRFSPHDRIAYRDPTADVALLSLRRTELPLTRLMPLTALAGWPPPAPVAGQFIAVSGFPAIARQRSSQKQVHFDAVTGLFRIETAGPDYCTCVFERAEWLTSADRSPPPPGTGLAE